MLDHQIFHKCFHVIMGNTACLHRLPRLPPAVVEVRPLTEGHNITITWTGGPVIYCRVLNLAAVRVTVDARLCSPGVALRLATVCRWYVARVQPEQCPGFWQMDAAEMVMALALAQHKTDELLETIGGQS